MKHLIHCRTIFLALVVCMLLLPTGRAYAQKDPLIEFQTDFGVPETAWLPADDGRASDQDDDPAQGRLF